MDLATSLQLGDLTTLGLAGYTPAGFYQAFLEAFNYTTWFWTIVFSTALSRDFVAPWFVNASAYKRLRNGRRTRARVFMWTSTVGGGKCYVCFWWCNLTVWMNLALVGAFFSQSMLSSISLSPEDDGTVSIGKVLLPLSAYGVMWVLQLPAGIVLSVLTFLLAHLGQMILSRPPFRNLPEIPKPKPKALRDLPPTKHSKSRY